MKDSDVKITISKDEMKASLELAQPEDGEEYNYSEVEKAIKNYEKENKDFKKWRKSMNEYEPENEGIKKNE